MKLNDTQISAKTLLRDYKKIDPYFVSRYGMNVYRGCSHGCIYCDGRNEKYRVEGDFDTDIAVKTNAAEIYRKEIESKLKRGKLKPSFLMLGGGVGDFYQQLNSKYRISRQLISILNEFSLPLHVLTKSAAVTDDFDLINELNQKSTALISFSLSSSHDGISRFLEPGASSPTERLKAVEKFRNAGIHSGVFLMPVVPRITDSAKLIRQSLKDCVNAGAEFVTFGGMTLKTGRQRDFFLRKVALRDTKTARELGSIYGSHRYGHMSDTYFKGMIDMFVSVFDEFDVPPFVPPEIFMPLFGKTESIAIMLEQIGTIRMSLGGGYSYFGAAKAIRSSGKELDTPSDIDSLLLKESSVVQTMKELIKDPKSYYQYIK
jgi:DNA repair photolyase